MAASLITVNSWNKLDFQGSEQKTAEAVAINPARIISVKTRQQAFKTTGITDLVYEVNVNQTRYQVTMIVTQALAAIVTAANASTTPA